MDHLETSTEHISEKTEDGKEGGPSFHFDLYDTEIVHKIAQAFLTGLATACVDTTRLASSSNGLAEARNLRSLTSRIKDLKTKLGPFEVKSKSKDNEEKSVEISSPINSSEKAES
ncbi:hypothetical protein FEM48_Zijuj12G0079800 [Ziziphus jujuba var. spinosa]|uniref:Uncharacterized protein n=1 Tax=Ziziphus jujuba var. spinosa TaxID=714518 RepID=A0A978UC42_ZIZJJ|nr:hypothetical protein FEM48_Zijuj12G0079800 [Ziziphus jujuba var. spinosa]